MATSGSKAKQRIAPPDGAHTIVGHQGGGGRFVGTFLDDKGNVSVWRAAEGLGLTKAQFAETACLSKDTLYRPSRLTTRKTQVRTLEKCSRSSAASSIGPVARSRRWRGIVPSRFLPSGSGQPRAS